MIILNYVIYMIMSCHFPKQHEDEGKFDMTYPLTSIFPILSKDMFLLIICHVCHNKMWQQIYWTLADSTVSYLFSLNIHLDNFDLGLIHSAFQCLLTWRYYLIIIQHFTMVDNSKEYVHTAAVGQSHVRLFVRSHRSLVRLLWTARFARALHCAHSFARSLTSLTRGTVIY